MAATDESKTEAETFACGCGLFGVLLLLAVTFIPPTNGTSWTVAEVVGPLWLAGGAVAAWLVWKWQLRSSRHTGYFSFAFGSLGWLGLALILYLEHSFLGEKRRSGL